jgi:hypothetical protein
MGIITYLGILVDLHPMTNGGSGCGPAICWSPSLCQARGFAPILLYALLKPLTVFDLFYHSKDHVPSFHGSGF